MNKTSEPKYPSLSKENMDTTVKPGDNFVQFANGGWMKKHPIPPEKSIYGAFNELQDLNNEQLRTIMDEAVKGVAGKSPTWKQIGDFYASGMDTNKIEKEGIKYLKPELDFIDNIKTAEDVQKVLAHLQAMGSPAPLLRRAGYRVRG